MDQKLGGQIPVPEPAGFAHDGPFKRNGPAHRCQVKRSRDTIHRGNPMLVPSVSLPGECANTCTAFSFQLPRVYTRLLGVVKSTKVAPSGIIKADTTCVSVSGTLQVQGEQPLKNLRVR
jgi:hypothetical protein